MKIFFMACLLLSGFLAGGQVPPKVQTTAIKAPALTPEKKALLKADVLLLESTASKIADSVSRLRGMIAEIKALIGPAQDPAQKQNDLMKAKMERSSEMIQKIMEMLARMQEQKNHLGQHLGGYQ